MSKHFLAYTIKINHEIKLFLIISKKKYVNNENIIKGKFITYMIDVTTC